MLPGKLMSTVFALATALSCAAGAILTEVGSDVRGLATYVRASSIASLGASTGGMSFSMGSQISVPFTFAQTGAFSQCTTSSEGTLEAANACAECIVKETCDETTCIVGPLNDSQLLFCPVGECCVRAIYDSENELNAVVIDGVLNENGEADTNTGKCPPCVVSDLTCSSVIVPDIDAEPGAEVECAGDEGTAPESDDDDTAAATRAPAATAAPAAPAAPAAAPAPAATDAPRTPASTAGPVAPAPVSSAEDIPTSQVDSEKNSGKCFPSAASVELEHGGVVHMDALAIGDSVKVGENKFSKVFMFTHKMADVNVDFVVIRTASGASLSLTGGHYIYANDALVAAATVAVGDELMLGHGERSAVTSVSHAPGRGLYNPQTLSGDIVVNGIVASTYTTAVDPGFAHSLLAPLRAMSRFGLGFTGLESGGGSLTAYAPGGAATIV